MEELQSLFQSQYHELRYVLAEGQYAELAMEHLHWVVILLPSLWFDLAWSATVSYNRRKHKYESYIYALASCMLVPRCLL